MKTKDYESPNARRAGLPRLRQFAVIPALVVACIVALAAQSATGQSPFREYGTPSPGRTYGRSLSRQPRVDIGRQSVPAPPRFREYGSMRVSAGMPRLDLDHQIGRMQNAVPKFDIIGRKFPVAAPRRVGRRLQEVSGFHEDVRILSYGDRTSPAAKTFRNSQHVVQDINSGLQKWRLTRSNEIRDQLGTQLAQGLDPSVGVAGGFATTAIGVSAHPFFGCASSLAGSGLTFLQTIDYVGKAAQLINPPVYLDRSYGLMGGLKSYGEGRNVSVLGGAGKLSWQQSLTPGPNGIGSLRVHSETLTLTDYTTHDGTHVDGTMRTSRRIHNPDASVFSLLKPTGGQYEPGKTRMVETHRFTGRSFFKYENGPSEHEVPSSGHEIRSTGAIDNPYRTRGTVQPPVREHNYLKDPAGAAGGAAAGAGHIPQLDTRTPSFNGLGGY